MAKLDPNTVVGILRGKLGNLVFVPAADGSVIVKHRPTRKAAFSSAQTANQGRFGRAAAYVNTPDSSPSSMRSTRRWPPSAAGVGVGRVALRRHSGLRNRADHPGRGHRYRPPGKPGHQGSASRSDLSPFRKAQASEGQTSEAE